MIPQVQSRVGKNGRCMNACLASILEVPERSVPDFQDDQYQDVNKWLRPRGLRYSQIPIGDTPPAGWHTTEGISPRGGMHAIVGLDGEPVWDPHPQDGTGRGLVKPIRYGLLTAVARDALQGKCLNTAAEALRTKHDELKGSPQRTGVASTAYSTLLRPVMDLVGEAERLLASAKLDDDPIYWRKIMESARRALATAIGAAQSGDYGKAAAYLDVALSTAHKVIDKMRHSGRARDSEIPPFKPGDPIRLKSGKRTVVAKCMLARNLLDEPVWHVSTTSGEVVAIPRK